MYFYGPPHMAKQKQDDQFEHTCSSNVRIRDVALKTSQKRWMIGRSGERGSRISVLAVRHDDDDRFIGNVSISHCAFRPHRETYIRKKLVIHPLWTNMILGLKVLNRIEWFQEYSNIPLKSFFVVFNLKKCNIGTSRLKNSCIFFFLH